MDNTPDFQPQNQENNSGFGAGTSPSMAPEDSNLGFGACVNPPMPMNQGVPISDASVPNMPASNLFESNSSTPNILTPNMPKPEVKKSKKTLIIMLSIVASVLVVAAMAALVAFFMYKKDIDTPAKGSDEKGKEVGSPSNNDAKSKEFENLTKEEAMAFLLDSDIVTRSILPKGYVSQEVEDAYRLSGHTMVSDLDLVYSYGDINELKKLANDRYLDYFSKKNGETVNFEVKEYDYYAIVTSERAKNATSCDFGYHSDCDSLLSFKREYLDYLNEETSPHSYNDRAYINPDIKDPKIISELLRTYSLFVSTGFNVGPGNVYNYSFKEQDDKFVLTTEVVGVGLNLELMKDSSNFNVNNMSDFYAINLYRRHYAASKKDGEISLVPVETSPETSYMEPVKSLSITSDEYKKLAE